MDHGGVVTGFQVLRDTWDERSQQGLQVSIVKVNLSIYVCIILYLYDTNVEDRPCKMSREDSDELNFGQVVRGRLAQNRGKKTLLYHTQPGPILTRPGIALGIS